MDSTIMHEINLTEPLTNIKPALNFLQGDNPNGDHISFTNRYMMKNEHPFVVVAGEFHYSRYDYHDWEKELVKMKMGGINVVTTYVIWIHHEENKGEFNWTGNKNLRHFIKICQKVGLEVFIRVGPFVHAEVRNGGLPDWLFMDPAKIRSLDDRFMSYVKTWYQQISYQVKGLLFKDGGPIIGVQLDNEYGLAGSTVEITTGTTNQWFTSGEDGEDYIRKLKNIAIESGLDTPIYTATGWGGAMAPTDSVLPLWGGYAYWPWVFFDKSIKKHPLTPEFIYRDYKKQKTYNFEPRYDPTTIPYACAEMGSGMNSFYDYRFKLLAKSVEALANIKIAGGCNFLGYYMYHGGTNPNGKTTPFLNEITNPKMSYDYQAPIKETGEIRESYKRLKRVHYFMTSFESQICDSVTVLPNNAENIDPSDGDSLRFATRVSEQGNGFVFINNFQDHKVMPEKDNFSFMLHLKNEDLRIPLKGSLSLGSDASCILPFNFDLNNGICLKYATEQLITSIKADDGTPTYFFFSPDKMPGEFSFEDKNLMNVTVSDGTIKKTDGKYLIQVNTDNLSKIILTTKDNQTVQIYAMTDKQSLNFWKVNVAGRDNILFSDQTLLVENNKLKIEADLNEVTIQTIAGLIDENLLKQLPNSISEELLVSYHLSQMSQPIGLQIKKLSKDRLLLTVSSGDMDTVDDAILKIDYIGDIAWACMNNKLVSDDFNNETTWETRLKPLITAGNNEIYVYITPITKNQIVKSDSPMAARSATTEGDVVEAKSITVETIYDFVVN